MELKEPSIIIKGNNEKKQFRFNVIYYFIFSNILELYK